LLSLPPTCARIPPHSCPFGRWFRSSPCGLFFHQIAAVTFPPTIAHIAIWRPHSPLRPRRDQHEMPPPRSSCRWACQFAPKPLFIEPVLLCGGNFVREMP